jgi:very-short-patch-repair endonuclease
MLWLNKQDLCYFEELLQKYKKKPITCDYCGKPLSFKEFVSQFDQEYKFCTKRCFHTFKNITVSDENKSFNSLTEKVIYKYLAEQYPHKTIFHNVEYLIPPYELDFIFPEEKLVIEYNGTLHYTSKYGKKKNKKTKFNDQKKKKLVCDEMVWRMCRLWSTIGLYTREEYFKSALAALKEGIDKLLECPSYGDCVDIVVLKNGDLDIFYNENDLSKIYKEENKK